LPTPDNIADYAKQWAYLQWLESTYKQYENDWENIPDTISMTAKTASGIYQSRFDNEFHAVIIAPFSGESAVMAQSDEFTVTVSMETYDERGNLPETSAEYYGDDYSVGVRTAILNSGYYVKQAIAGAPYFYDSTFNNGNTGMRFYTCEINIPKRGTPGVQSQNTFGSAEDFIGHGSTAQIGTGGLLTTITGDIDTANPWDYYNNDILPDVDPDNAAFPDGYSPIPEKPDPEKPELPGDVENSGDDIEPNDTTGIGAGFGFMTQYALRGSDITELGKMLWNGFDPNDPDIDEYIRNFVYEIDPTTGSVNFADIMDFFVSLKCYPMPLGNVHTLSAHGHALHIGSGVKPLTMTNIIHTMDSYSGTIDAGECTIPFWFGDYRDYSLQIAAYLPYCGTAELNPADVLGGRLHCFYEIDFCTGACTAFIYCTTWDGKTFPVVALPGQMGADIPVTATNAGRIASRILGDRINAAENMLGVLKFGATGVGAIASGNFAGAVRSGISAFLDPAISEQKQLATIGERGAIAAPVLSSGGGFTSFKNPATAYIQVRSPFYAVPENYKNAVGDPASKQVKIGDCSGFCQFINVDVSGITTDAADQTAIRQALETGIFI
jgi:hypothetical protein